MVEQTPKAKTDEGQLFVSVGIRQHANGKWEAALFVNGNETQEDAKKMADALKEVAEQKLSATMKVIANA